MEKQPSDAEAENQTHKKEDAYRPVIEWRLGDEFDAIYFSCPVEHVCIEVRGRPDKYQEILEGLEQGDSLCMDLEEDRLVLYRPREPEGNN